MNRDYYNKFEIYYNLFINNIMAMFIENLCIFMKNNGNIIFRDINLNSKKREEFYMSSLDNQEYIDYNDVFINTSWVNPKYYKKYYYYDDNTRNYRFLEWKKTKDNTWDWFITEDINETELTDVINYLKLENDNKIIENKEIILQKIKLIINEYSLINNEHDKLIEVISNYITEYLKDSTTWPEK